MIRKCACGYTLKTECCGKATTNPEPAKYSPEDKYARHRREYKENYKKE